MEQSLTATPAYLSDPSGSASLVTAAHWVEGTLLGTVATMAAVIAVAAIGFLMLSGRVDVRRGAIVVIGCFVLFGAPTIAQALAQLATGAEQRPPLAVVASRTATPAAITATPAYDPYAGAAVPPR